MRFIEKAAGFELQTDRYLAFFGKHNSSLDLLRKSYPAFEWSWVKQVHGSHVVFAETAFQGQIEADAQWTTSPQVALITRTADCLPVLAYNSKTHAALSIHAGWRGVAQRIIPQTLDHLRNEGHLAEDFEFFLGPHILKNSFELQKDTVELLRTSTKLQESIWLSTSATGYLVDLLSIAKSQIQECGGRTHSISDFIFDTKTDLRFHSFRRDRENSGRQISFLALFNP
ncbi:MAG: polyphenol oxidase family protein [Bdellovibrionales bacterium]